MPDKMKLLGIDELRMSEVREFEQVSGYTISDVMDLPGGAPMSVIMALAYLTEKRSFPRTHRSVYLNLTADKFIERLSAKFLFDASDDHYDAWTVEELKTELVNRGLDKTGRKPELIGRLREADEAGDEDPDPPVAA